MAEPLLLAYSAENAGTVIWLSWSKSQPGCGASLTSSSTCVCLTVASLHCGWWFGCLGPSGSACLLACLVCLLLRLPLPAVPGGS